MLKSEFIRETYKQSQEHKCELLMTVWEGKVWIFISNTDPTFYIRSIYFSDMKNGKN